MNDDRKKEEQAFGFLEVAAKSLSKKDDCSVFGEMISSQLRKLTPRNQAIARNRIQNLIFELEMQEMDDASQNNTVAPPYYTPSGPSSQSSYDTRYEPTILNTQQHTNSIQQNTQQQTSTDISPNPGNAFGEVQQFLCFNLNNADK